MRRYEILLAMAGLQAGCAGHPAAPTATTAITTPAPSGPSFDCAQADSDTPISACTLSCIPRRSRPHGSAVCSGC